MSDFYFGTGMIDHALEEPVSINFKEEIYDFYNEEYANYFKKIVISHEPIFISNSFGAIHYFARFLAKFSNIEKISLIAEDSFFDYVSFPFRFKSILAESVVAMNGTLTPIKLLVLGDGLVFHIQRKKSRFSFFKSKIKKPSNVTDVFVFGKDKNEGSIYNLANYCLYANANNNVNVVHNKSNTDIWVTCPNYTRYSNFYGTIKNNTSIGIMIGIQGIDVIGPPYFEGHFKNKKDVKLFKKLLKEGGIKLSA